MTVSVYMFLHICEILLRKGIFQFQSTLILNFYFVIGKRA